jgi:hypothetical protein
MALKTVEIKFKFQKTVISNSHLNSPLFPHKIISVKTHTYFHKFIISLSIFLIQISCTWEDVKLLRTDMEKKAASAIHFRTKLLTAIYQMQSALGITDLGQFYHKPLKDSHGTVALSCILNVKVSDCNDVSLIAVSSPSSLLRRPQKIVHYRA